MAVDPKRVQSVFLVAVEQSDRIARTAILDRECESDPELRRRVEALLAAHDAPGSFLADIATQPDAVSSSVGSQLGPYKLLDVIGEGGMGVVWMAEQKEPVVRRVAIKIIKPGMGSPQVIARFEAERQALAVMDHPNIAKVFDAGTSETGRPYFVMELVKGVPITQYCDAHQLTPEQRLKLFVDVCHAVQHAHQKGIIHRDLKPSNVLVAEYDEKPMPKVIDFGVAKAVGQQLTEKTMFTAFGQVIGTIEYMSPEHAKLNQLDLDTRSDVYSLGVILYELLTGQTPLDRKRLQSAALDEMLRMIREEEPQRPSTRLSASQTLPSIAANRHIEPAKLTRIVHGELDWIVMKALEKERGRRYDSANALAADVQRYLADEPVSAAAPSRAYRIRKFVRRNKGPVISSVLLLLVLIAGIIGTTIGLIGQARQRLEAQAQADIAAAVSKFQADMLTAADPRKLLGDKVTVLQAVMVAAKELDSGKLDRQPLVEASLRDTIGLTLRALGRYTEAEAQLRRALELRRHNLSAGAPDIVKSQHNLALVLRDMGKLDEAESLMRLAFQTAREQLPPDNPDRITVMRNLGALLAEQGKLAEAEPLLREALARCRAAQPPDYRAVNQSIVDLNRLLWRQDKFSECTALSRESLDIARKTLPPKHPDLAGALVNLASVIEAPGPSDETEPLLREALAIQREVLPPAHPDLMYTLSALGLVLYDRGKFEQVEPLLHEALDIARNALPPGHFYIGEYALALGMCLTMQREFAQGELLLVEAERVLATSPMAPEGRHEACVLWLNNLYEAWNSAEPHKGYDAKAARWRAKLPTSRPVASQPATQP